MKKPAPQAGGGNLPPKARTKALHWILPGVDQDDLPPKAKQQVNCLQSVAEDLLGENIALREQVVHLKDTVCVLKGEKKRPLFKPSRMHQDAGKTTGHPPQAQDRAETGQEPGPEGQCEDLQAVPAPEKPRRPGSDKASKTASLKIDEDRIIKPAQVLPPGSIFKGYRHFHSQDLLMKSVNIRYRLERWKTPDGRYVTGELPAALEGRHFEPGLVAYLLYQHHHCHVTQPLLHEQLCEWGVAISSGQVNALLQNGKARFHEEKGAILKAGLRLSSYVTVDDTGGRHKGNNCYVTHIGNDYFDWFQTSSTKSRINFLELLCCGQADYRINADALAHMEKQGLSPVFRDALRDHATTVFTSKTQWHDHMDALEMCSPRFRKIATEGALLGSLHGMPIARHMAIISDDAGQFNVLIHGLCWVHAERLVHKLLPLNDAHRLDIARVRGQIWDLYAGLKAYKAQPVAQHKDSLSKQFDEIFTQWTSYWALNLLLARIHKNKPALLLVLERPEIPLHTNGSERALREQVQKQKISGGTRSDLGRQCRDTFSTLKHTCRKLGISFWRYLTDRLSCSDHIALLPHIIEQRIASSQCDGASWAAPGY